jgi:hypothetical protein
VLGCKRILIVETADLLDAALSGSRIGQIVRPRSQGHHSTTILLPLKAAKDSGVSSTSFILSMSGPVRVN